MTSDFETWSVAAGCKLGEFANLPPATQRKLIRLMARISEKSFRRGFQHGVVNKDTLCVDPQNLPGHVHVLQRRGVTGFLGYRGSRK